MPLRIAAAGLSDRGRQRPRNEDAFLVDPARGLAVVADGMGGHRAGDVASALAVDEVKGQLAARSGSLASSGEWMARAVLAADARVRLEAAASAEREGMGTTITALVVDAEAKRIVVGHVGDSRAYLYDRGRLHQLTRDHTWVQEQVDSGALRADQARGHPYGHILAQAAGAGDAITPQVLEGDARVGQVYVLCTDGLTNMLSDATMQTTLADALPDGLVAAARALVDAANEAGGIDNITAVLVSVDEG